MRPRAALGDAEPSECPGAFEPLALADTPIMHRCMIYEKFYCPKWYTHHLKENTYFYIRMVQYYIKLLYVLKSSSQLGPQWSK